MAEFCFDCWKKINQKNFSKWEYCLSRELERCEECGEWKRVVVCRRFYDVHPRVRELFFLCEAIWACFSRLWKKP